MIFTSETQAQELLATMNTSAVVVQTTHGHWAITSAREAARPAKTCSICGEFFREFANNAEPVNDGQCCAYCDDHVVTPARIALATGVRQ